MSTGYSWEGIRQVRATLLGERHVPERLCGGRVYLGRYIKCSTFTFYLYGEPISKSLPSSTELLKGPIPNPSRPPLPQNWGSQPQSQIATNQCQIQQWFILTGYGNIPWYITPSPYPTGYSNWRWTMSQPQYS